MKYRSDIYYIDEVLNNNVSAYSTLIDKHKNMVYTVILRIVKNREDAEEIAQDTFIKAYQSLKSFKRDSKFSTWLYRIAYNSAISKTRKKYLDTRNLDFDLIENYSVDEIIENVNGLDLGEQKKLINEVIKTLNPEENTLINLFYFNKNSTEEISEIMNLSKSNVKVKLHRIRKILFNEVQQILSQEYKEVII